MLTGMARSWGLCRSARLPPHPAPPLAGGRAPACCPDLLGGICEVLSQGLGPRCFMEEWPSPLLGMETLQIAFLTVTCASFGAESDLCIHWACRAGPRRSPPFLAFRGSGVMEIASSGSGSEFVLRMGRNCRMPESPLRCSNLRSFWCLP